MIFNANSQLYQGIKQVWAIYFVITSDNFLFEAKKWLRVLA